MGLEMDEGIYFQVWTRSGMPQVLYHRAYTIAWMIRNVWA